MFYRHSRPKPFVILLGFKLHDTLTLDELLELTGTTTTTYLLNSLRTLCVAGLIEKINDVPTFKKAVRE